MPKFAKILLLALVLDFVHAGLNSTDICKSRGILKTTQRPISNTNHTLTYTAINESIRPKRNAQKPDQTAALRKRLQAEKRKEQMMNDPRPVLEPTYNYTSPIGYNTTGGRLYGGVSKEQRPNSAHDTLRQLMTTHKKEVSKSAPPPEIGCDFETECTWKWKTDVEDGFAVASAGQNATGPRHDANNDAKGHFLLLRLQPSTRELHVTSPLFNSSRDTCRVQLWIYQEAMAGGQVRIVVDTINHTQWVADKIVGDDSKTWVKHEKTIGKITQNFSIILEVVPAVVPTKGATIAFDNVQLVECFPEPDDVHKCTPPQFRCTVTNTCIKKSQVCDITQDCLDGEDENQNCDRMPPGARCNFEQDWCGWYSVEGKLLQWIRHNGSTPTNKTGPNFDHTYRNTTGKYLYVNMATKGAEFANSATLKSVIFNPPPLVHGNISSPFYNSCMIRFYLHQTGYHRSGMELQVTELRPSENITNNILWSNYDHGNEWVRQVMVLPNITHKYYLHFDARKGIRYIGDIALDDISLSPECFGLNIPESELRGYNYWNPLDEHMSAKEPHKDFVNQTIYEITTCNTNGRFGPAQTECDEAYQDTKVEVKVMHEAGLSGVQKWTAPNEGFYTFILYGASGGKGSGGMGSSRGAMVRIVVELRKGQQFYILVGQEGTNACFKSLGHRPQNTSCITQRNDKNLTLIRAVLQMEVADGGGGGGGGTFIFFRNRTSHLLPLAVAAGGGGLGLSQFSDNGLQHGQAINTSLLPITGKMYGLQSGGAGGGWRMFQGQITDEQRMIMGEALLMGGVGGKACYKSTDGRGDGGFGGGGGGCISGGGGGGYSGGNSVRRFNSTNGEGGYSYLDPTRTIPSLSEAHSGYNAGRGSVLILPAVPGCGCDYRCLALDARRSQVACICPRNWRLDGDGKSCILPDSVETYPAWFVIGLIATVICLMVAFAVVCFMLYNRYQQRASGILRRKMLSGADLQLNRLRVASDSMMTEYNPSYEFGGVVYTLKDLKDIPRDQLRLVKALGQGAFGEVYQGFYRQRSGDTVEMPVAVKTLPEMSTNQAEMDFLMEALIMSKFHHANIVHFIGVCFDKHPRFIVLELLAGGDLKNFLRESRPKPDRGSSLTMKDLVLISVDVAKGCRYLEENRFIHRDIAARNCLLTTKGPGRVVKIADFGMSRDVYRSDYYRKGGKAMLPIKWMPPEAFLDGIFTSKTDVWSFGVLLWEIMSMGYMPYPGCANREVMQLVTSGGRLEPPTNCPGPIYGIMTQCWHPTPEQRPSFALILERLDYCVQDPQVMNAPLPVFSRPPSHERDATLMRPHNGDDTCLQVVPQTADYLIPNHHHNFPPVPNPVGSTSSVDKLLPENSDSWETSFVMPQSKSTQPLLQETELTATTGADSMEKLLTNETTAQTNHNNNVKQQQESTLKSGVSLDASALIKQTMPTNLQKKSYANVNAGDGNLTGNGVLPNGPFANQNSYHSNSNANKFLNESEISC